MGFYGIIKSFDVFGADINFYIKSEKNYTSFCGGILFLIYIILCIIYIIINLVSLINRSNISVIHYSKELFRTEDLSFNNITSSFAVGLQCDDYNDSNGKLEDYFELEFNYVHRVKLNGTIRKDKLKLPLHICTYDDFHEDLRDDLDVNKITTDYYCPDERNHSIKGIITDEEFSFYELILQTKQDFYKDKYFEIISSCDCKFNLFYTDVSIDVTNVDHPINYYLNNIFIQLATVFFKKVDTFFNIKSYEDDINLFFSSPEKTNYLAFARTQLYDIYLGENRYEERKQDYKKYAKYFIKADKTKTIIERKCKKFTEFLASIVSILSGVLSILRIIIGFLNYSFAIKNILDTLLEERKEFTKKIISIKNKFPGRQSNGNQPSESVKKIDDSKVKMNPITLTNTLDKLSQNNMETKLYENTVLNNYNINNFYIGLKRNNFINFNSDIKTIGGLDLENKLTDEIRNKNLQKLDVKNSLSNIESKNYLKNNDQTELADCCGIKLKSKNNVIILDHIIKEQITNFYLHNCFPFCRKKKIINHEAYLKKFLKQLFLRLDVINYLKIVDRFEILFQILFKPTDLNLLNIFSKFNLNELTNKGGLFYNNDDFKERINTNIFLNNYIQLLNNKDKTVIEERLQKLIQKEMSEL